MKIFPLLASFGILAATLLGLPDPLMNALDFTIVMINLYRPAI